MIFPNNKRFVGGIVVVLLAVTLLIWGLTALERNRAEGLLKSIREVQLGESTFADVELIARKYGGIPWYNSPADMTCTFQRCELRFVFENKPLTSLHLIRYVGLIARLSVRDGIVVGREIDYGRETGRYNQFEYEVLEGSLWKEDGLPAEQRAPGLWRLNVEVRGHEGFATTVRVRLGPTSSPEQRARAYALNLFCLDSVFDCHHPSAIFPRGIPYLGAPYQTHTESW